MLDAAAEPLPATRAVSNRVTSSKADTDDNGADRASGVGGRTILGGALDQSTLESDGAPIDTIVR
jgi:hypothetical protein